MVCRPSAFRKLLRRECSPDLPDEEGSGTPRHGCAALRACWFLLVTRVATAKVYTAALADGLDAMLSVRSTNKLAQLRRGHAVRAADEGYLEVVKCLVEEGKAE